MLADKNSRTASWMWRTSLGRYARRLLFALMIILFLINVFTRDSMYILTRKMEAVITGLSNLEIDGSSEQDLVRTVPYLVRAPWEGQVKRTPETGEVDVGAVRAYYVRLSNETTWMKYGRLISALRLC